MRVDARRNYDKLIEAARAAFSERGSAASLEDIARRARAQAHRIDQLPDFENAVKLVEAAVGTASHHMADDASPIGRRMTVARWHAAGATADGLTLALEDYSKGAGRGR
jgi:hypothetical protein